MFNKRNFALILVLVFSFLVLAACSNDAEFTERKYSSAEDEIVSVNIDVRDREIQVSLSQDNQIHITYFDSEKEFYDISVSDDKVLTMTALFEKKWTDYIGISPSPGVKKISLEIPDSLLSSLTLSTTNKDIIVSDLSVINDIILSTNNGNLTFEKLAVGNMLKLTAKNGDIQGVVVGSYDDFSIITKIKKGDSNLPLEKKSGDKKLEVTNNNGNINIEIVK